MSEKSTKQVTPYGGRSCHPEFEREPLTLKQDLTWFALVAGSMAVGFYLFTWLVVGKMVQFLTAH